MNDGKPTANGDAKMMSGMSDVDRSGTAERYADLLARAMQVQAHKARSYELLQLRPGLRMLEIGVGTGDDAVAIARRIAPGGRVTALDNSRECLDRARRLALEVGVDIEFVFGDAQALDFASDSFDVCRAERVFQHLSDPAAALEEMKRVVRPGGWVQVIDADFDTLSIDASDREITREVVRLRAEAPPHGWIARQLPRLFREAGLELLTIEGITFAFTDHELAFEIYELDAITEQIVERGEFDRHRVDSWRAELELRGEQGGFFLASTGFMAVGRKA